MIAGPRRFSSEDYVEATVRPQDVSMEGRYVRVPYIQLVQRYSGYVRVAASRNAAAVAGSPLRVFRRLARGKASAFGGRRVNRHAALRMARGAAVSVKRMIGEGDDVYEITDPAHPVRALLDRPNPRDSGYELFEAVQTWAELTGNGYIAAVRGLNGWPVELWPMASQYVRALPDRDRFIRGYVYGTGIENETAPPIDADDVMHLRFPNPLGDPYYGMGPLSACVVQADLAQAVSTFQLAALDNGAQPGLIVTMPGATKDQREETRVSLDRQLRGPAKGGRTVVLSGPNGMTIEGWKLQEKEMSYLQGFRDVREAIANVFDMPVALLTMESAALATAEKALEHWHTMSIAPRQRRLEDRINGSLIPMFAGIGDGLFVAFDPPDSGTDAEDSTAATTLYSGGVATLNEAREMVGLPPSDDDDANERKKAPEPMGLAFGGGLFGGEPAKEKPVQFETNDDIKADAPPDGKDATAARSACGCGCDWFASVVRHTTRSVPDSPWSEQERAMLDALRRWFAQSYLPSLLASIDYATGQIGTPPSVGDLADTLAVAIAPKQTAAFVAALGDTTQAAVPTLTKQAERWLEARRETLVKSLNEAANKQVAQAIQAGIREGKAGPALTDAVKETLGTVSAYAAERIAATETAKAYNGGREEGWKASGSVEAKEWLLSGDPCQFCAALAGKVVPLGEPFVKKGDVVVGTNGGVYHCDYEDVMHPALHPGCRCGLGAVFKEAEK